MTRFREFNQSKFLLTIRVVDTKNNSFTLINNLPFNTNDYKYILMLIWDNYKDYFIMNSENRMKSINFSYYVDRNKGNQYKVNSQYMYRFLYRLFLVLISLIVICTLFLYILDYYNYDILLIKRDIPNIHEDIIPESYIHTSNIYYTKTNGVYNSLTYPNSIFTPFINLFNKTGTASYNYFPSYFVPTPFNIPVVQISSLDFIVDHQYKILHNNVDNLHTLFLDLAYILHEYKQIVKHIAI
jgi:hypothetical protein